MISFDVTERTPQTRGGGSEYEPMLKAAYEDRKPREARFTDLAEATRTRDTLRKVASRNKIGLDMELATEGEEGSETYVLILAAREQREQKGAKRGRKAAVSADETPENGDDNPFEEDDDSETTGDDDAEESAPEPETVSAPAPSTARPSTARVTRPAKVRQRA